MNFEAFLFCRIQI